MCVCVCVCVCVSVCISLILRAHVYSCWCTERGSLHTHVTTFRRSSAFLPAIFFPECNISKGEGFVTTGPEGAGGRV